MEILAKALGIRTPAAERMTKGKMLLNLSRHGKLTLILLAITTALVTTEALEKAMPIITATVTGVITIQTVMGVPTTAHLVVVRPTRALTGTSTRSEEV
jgi:hypothetical protein